MLVFLMYFLQDEIVGNKSTACDDVDGAQANEDILLSVSSKKKQNDTNICWNKNNYYSLTGTDAATLQNSTGWLNDRIIYSAQILLKNQFPFCGGFQNTILGCLLNFEVETSEFIQVLHNGNGHWLTISMIGKDKTSEICVYDSVYLSINCHVKEQIAALFQTSQKLIKVKIMDMQIQCGSSDCGVFAIATAIGDLHDDIT